MATVFSADRGEYRPASYLSNPINTSTGGESNNHQGKLTVEDITTSKHWTDALTFTYISRLTV